MLHADPAERKGDMKSAPVRIHFAAFRQRVNNSIFLSSLQGVRCGVADKIEFNGVAVKIEFNGSVINCKVARVTRIYSLNEFSARTPICNIGLKFIT